MALDNPVTDPRELFDAARASHRAGEWRVAVDLWQQVRAALPSEALAYSEGVVAMREAGDLEGADVLAAEAIRLFPDYHGAYAVWADLAMRRRDWQEAAQRWAEFRRRFPKDGQGYVHGAAALMELGQDDSADAVLAEGCDQMPDSPWVMATWGYFAQHHRNPEEALRRWSVVRMNVPDHPVGYTTAAVILRDLGRYVEAEAMLASALARFPNDPSPVIEYAAVSQARGDHREAVARWALVRARFPDEQTGYVGGAGALRAAGRPQEAEALIAAATERFPDSAHLLFEYARAAQGRGDAETADRYWREARARFPTERAPFTEGARALLAMGRGDDADAVLATARDRFPNDVELANSWADLAARRRDWGEAATRWAAVATQFPFDAEPVVRAVEALQEARRGADADALLAVALDRFPDSAAIARAWAELAAQRRTWQAAADRWAVYRQRFPSHAIGYAEAARSLHNAGQDAEADALLAEATTRIADDPAIAVAWAELAANRHDWPEAARRWDEVRRRFPGEERAWIECADALAKSGQIDQADDLAEEAIGRFPASEHVLTRWALLAGQHKNADAAVPRWSRVRETFPNIPYGYTFGANNLLDAGLATEAVALIAVARERFPNNLDVLRTAAELAARRGDLVAAAALFEDGVRRHPSEISLVQRLIETLTSLQRYDDLRLVLETARGMWPEEEGFLRRRAMLDIQTGQIERAYEFWRSIRDEARAGQLRYAIAWAIFSEGPSPEIAADTLLFLIQEPDDGGRHWLPVLAEMLQLRGRKPPLFHVALNILEAAPDAPYDTATFDVLRCALLYDRSDQDIERLIGDYVTQGRLALTAYLFCQNYWKTKRGIFARYTAVFERHIAAKLADLSWVTEDNAVTLLAYLNFAAVFSDQAYADLVRAMRLRLDLPAMQRHGLHTIIGAAANIALTASIDAPAAPAILREPRRLKVALCVSGQLRGFQEAVPTWSNLGLDGHDVSVHVHVWKAIGRNWVRIWGFTRSNKFVSDMLSGENAVPFLANRYPRLAAAAAAAALANNEADEPMLRSVFGTDSVAIEDDTKGPARDRTNIWKMHYKIEAAHRLALEKHGDYDLMIRMRPDREVVRLATPPDWHAIRAQSHARKMVFTDERYLFTERHTWLDDQFAVGTRDVMDVYSSMFSNVEERLRFGNNLLDAPNFIRAHVSLFYHCFYNGVIGREVQGVSFGRLLDPAMLSVAEIVTLARQDIAERALDDFDRQFLELAEATLRGQR